ncbi:alpha-mannosidase [Calothrix sp. PCC 7507]|uniref:alpha-mannosidase n=1 Tax=Calothrix sp. PCC 7507 TaxID=99598 RepID=UPI00029EC474|nr:alpha-mannosidase [Calothrix sp. PCC 7507]AFY33594.1 Alpha-mannosidase [Calothrix sp. PCC 7507]
MTLPLSPSHTKFISEAIAQLRSCCQVNLQSSWLYQECDWNIREVATSDLCQWTPAELNAKGHIAWTKGKNTLWLVQKLTIPQTLQGYPLSGLSLRLSLLWWADAAEVYLNGELVLAGDLFDCSPRVLISREVTPGEEFIVALRLVSPGHDHGALVRSLLVYESIDYNHPDPGFVADELAVLQLYLEKFAPEKLAVLAGELRKMTTPIDAEWENVLFSLRQHLQELNLYPSGAKSKIYLLGHAHLDLAWLWPVNETWNAAQSTFESVLKLQQDFPELIFCHSTPALYAWIEAHRPDLFAAIQQAVAAGRWEVIGGLWVEPELNLIAGEAIARQLLYGQRYIQEKFGKISPIVWVPDSFGFCATLPQFFVNAGIEYFVTQKLRWNDTTKFDYDAFWWRSPDGSQVFSYMSALIGEGIDPVKMANYACEWYTKTSLPDALWLPGVGDHGGGPTRDMLETAQRWQNSPFFPNLEFTTAEKYLQQIKQNSPHLPIWEDELYLEFHRGCYTTHADQKRWNRRCENLLYQAELFATLASISCGVTYPQAAIEKAWKQVLFQQFHDILPGSSITQVYQDALPEWQQVEQVGTKILEESILAIASQAILPPPPHPEAKAIFIFNSLNWMRSQVVEIIIPELEHNLEWQIYDFQGNEMLSQRHQMSISFLANDIPSCGYRVFWLCPCKSSLESSEPLVKDFILENEYLQVTVDPATGDLSGVFDKINQRQVLNGAGNQLQGFQDSGQYWDAWNIDPNYAQHPLPPAELSAISYLERGVLRNCVRVVRTIGQSTFSHDYILETKSAVLKIQTTVNWQENQILVKVAFPLNVEADFATYEIPCGAIRRTTKPQTPAEQAKWEVPALRWADLTGETDQGIYGVSLLNDCKYGYDSQPNQLRLTLLRSPNWPDPEADTGIHEFTYALYPHAGSWESAHTVRRGYELNIPLQVVFNPPHTHNSAISASDRMSFLNLSAENLILMALKPAEDEPKQLIMRCYECHGETAELSLRSDLGLSLGESVDLLERSHIATEFSSKQQILTIQPGKITTFKIIPEE